MSFVARQGGSESGEAEAVVLGGTQGSLEVSAALLGVEAGATVAALTARKITAGSEECEIAKTPAQACHELRDATEPPRSCRDARELRLGVDPRPEACRGAHHTRVACLVAAQAAGARDALIKACYERLFEAVVSRVNVALRPGGAQPPAGRERRSSSVGSKGPLFVGLLDIFGSEVFETNGFEQARSRGRHVAVTWRVTWRVTRRLRGAWNVRP